MLISISFVDNRYVLSFKYSLYLYVSVLFASHCLIFFLSHEKTLCEDNTLPV